MENKNTIVALALMLVVWIGFSLLNPAQPPETAVPAAVQEVSSPAVQPLQSPAVPAPLPPVAEPSTELRELVVETDTFRARFTNAGARLKSLHLKQFTESADPQSPLVSLIEVGPERLATLRTTGSDGLAFPSDTLFSISFDENRLLLSGAESRTVTFSATTAAGLLVEKQFTFRGDRYDFDLRTRVTNGGTVPASGTLGLTLVQPWDESMQGSSFDVIGPATLVGEEVETDKVADLAKASRSYGSDAVWSAFQTKYFLSAAVPLQGAAEKVRIEKVGDSVENTFESPYRSLAVGESISDNYLLFFGPRDLDVLKAVDHRLAEIIDFGFFGLIAKPLLHVLLFFYAYVGNYGVAIILLTVIIKILFWPLTQKSYSSMKAMQKLQPQMQKIREKYKNDRERLNREIMEMYKNNRVNPLGGCLPMLVQIPVFFALYKVLLDNIALRHAPFALWITDLSAKDPYYVTPIIMGATMFIQQKMTPTTMDPTQAKMFMIMPVVFTFMFLNFPAGLVIYWLVNNVLTILQQFFINRKA